MVSAESQAAMDAARKAVAEFLARSGRHNTTVHEKIAAAVKHETITRTVHEEEEEVVDREIHADHYHLSVQPITDEETLEEQHSHNLLPVDHQTFEHDDREEVQARLRAERAKFRDEVVRVDGEKTRSVRPIVMGEHVHHHVHELIQPVINKHTIEPIVIHTTIQIHEVHHNAAQHHAASALPAVTMAEFLRQGGVLSGREERYDFFEGEPRSVGGNVGNAGDNAQRNEQTAPSSSQPSSQPQVNEREEQQNAPEPSQGSANASSPPTAPAPPPASPMPLPPPPSSGIHPPQAAAQNQLSLFPAHLGGSPGSHGPGPHPATSSGPQMLRPGRANNNNQQRPGSVARQGRAAAGEGQQPQQPQPQQRRPTGP